jgi:hypothetical protein
MNPLARLLILPLFALLLSAASLPAQEALT